MATGSTRREERWRHETAAFRQGGTVVLGETTEVYGGEHLLTRRARTPEVAQDLLDRIGWWEEYVAYWGASIDNNPTPETRWAG